MASKIKNNELTTDGVSSDVELVRLIDLETGKIFIQPAHEVLTSGKFDSSKSKDAVKVYWGQIDADGNAEQLVNEGFLLSKENLEALKSLIKDAERKKNFNYEEFASTFGNIFGILIKSRNPNGTASTAANSLSEKRQSEFQELFLAASTQKEVGKLLRDARKEAGLTLDEIAEITKIPRSTVARIDAGTGNPSWQNVNDYAVALGIK